MTPSRQARTQVADEQTQEISMLMAGWERAT